jgi:hypothetical protein
MTRALLLTLGLFAAGCTGDSISSGDYPREEAGPEGTDVAIPAETYEKPSISEFGTHKTRGIAKTIEWPGISTDEGTSFLGDTVVVDRIFREDAENFYAVRVRLKNPTKTPVKGEYLVRFYTRQGERVLGYIGVGGQEERWTGFVIEPFGSVVVNDFCRVSGAEGFRLAVRGAGSKGDGTPDDPSPEAKEERKRAREGKK